MSDIDWLRSVFAAGTLFNIPHYHDRACALANELDRLAAENAALKDRCEKLRSALRDIAEGYIGAPKVKGKDAIPIWDGTTELMPITQRERARQALKEDEG